MGHYVIIEEIFMYSAEYYYQIRDWAARNDIPYKIEFMISAGKYAPVVGFDEENDAIAFILKFGGRYGIESPDTAIIL